MFKARKSLYILLLICTFLGTSWLYPRHSKPKQASMQIPTFVISLRKERWQSFQNRWEPFSWKESLKDTFDKMVGNTLEEKLQDEFKLQKWTATDGRRIALDDPRWDRRLFLDPAIDFPRFVKRGEIGCLDSHLRIWQYMIENKLPIALIFEDDANVSLQCDGHKLITWIKEFNESKLKDEYDIVFLGYDWECPILQSVSDHFSEVDFSKNNSYHVMHALLLTQKGAQRLLDAAYPYRIPVDVYVAEEVRKKKLRALQVMPYHSAIEAVPCRSDTQGIH